MLDNGEIDYLLQATLSAVKRYGGVGPSLSHLAQVVSCKWPTEFLEVFGEDGKQEVERLLHDHRFIGDEADVRSVLTAGDDRGAVLADLHSRLKAAIAGDESTQSRANAQGVPAPVDTAAVTETAEPPTPRWPARTERFVDPVVPRGDLLERGDVVDQILGTLSRTRHCTPIILGPNGIGRTTLLAAVAARLAARDGSVLWRVDPSRLGPQPEESLFDVIEDCAPDSILAIDDIDAIADLASEYPSPLALKILTAAAKRTDRKLVLVCELKHYPRLDALSPNFASQLVPVRLSPLSTAAVRKIITGLTPELETHHGVKISADLRDSACAPARSIDTATHPGLAVDRLDAAASLASVLGETHARLNHAASVSAARTNPLRVAELSGRLSEYVKGQEHAVTTVASRLALTLARLDMNPGRPDGVFLFVGPTGVGKTRLARALSLCLFGSEERLIRLDMSEYAQDWAISGLTGPMVGYRGADEPQNWLTTRISETPDCVLLLDEIEKAHPVVWNTFLQVFDAGRLTDSRGLTADFANTVIVMTSNLGAAAASGPGLGFASPDASDERAREKIIAAVQETMAPELINCIDDLVVFNSLDDAAIETIATQELTEVTRRLASHGWKVSYGPEVIHHIAQTGYDPAYGARHLQRNIERGFLSLVASADDKSVLVSVSHGQLVLSKEPISAHAAASPPGAVGSAKEVPGGSAVAAAAPQMGS